MHFCFSNFCVDFYIWLEIAHYNHCAIPSFGSNRKENAFHSIQMYTVSWSVNKVVCQMQDDLWWLLWISWHFAWNANERKLCAPFSHPITEHIVNLDPAFHYYQWNSLSFLLLFILNIKCRNRFGVQREPRIQSVRNATIGNLSSHQIVFCTYKTIIHSW